MTAADDGLPPDEARRTSEEEARRRTAAEISLRAERIRILSEELRLAKREAETVKRELATLRRRRAVRVALAVAEQARPAAVVARRLRSTMRDILAQVPGASGSERKPRKRIRVTAAEDADFRARLDAALLPSATTAGPLVSAIVVNRDGIEHLRRLLPSLASIAYREIEVVLVDNGSTDASVAFATSLRLPYPLRVVRNPDNRSFSEANNQGAAAAGGDLFLLINNDVAPAGPHVLGHMVERLLLDESVAAVASRLIYPRRKGPQTGPSTAHADLSLQHRGITFATMDGSPLGRNLGSGEDPLGEAANTRRDVQAGTAACLLVRRTAFAAVGGFTLGYDYGTEDVDFSLKIRATGGRIVYEPQATFWHHESATQHLEERGARGIRQRANRELFADLWGPRIFREVFLDRVGDADGPAGAWSESPLHIGITLTRDDPRAGWGDYYTAHELGDALAGLGWQISYLERWRDAWYDPDPTIDVVVSLLDAFDVRRLPEGVVSIAWVRNWTDRWLGHPWFDEHDIVLASSARSKALIDARSAHVARLFPLATNPERFRKPESQGEPTTDVVFAGNHWGQDRGIHEIVPRLLSADHSVAVYGKGWEGVPGVAAVARGSLPYDDLPATYAGAAIVLDDTATPTLPYGAVNSRVFDALAVGTLVVTDNGAGAMELFGDRLPAADDAAGLAALVETYLADPEARRARADELRAIVLERHTYAHRARELRSILRDWADTRHIDIAIGPPTWEVATRWGDYHFGRAVQRALQRRGYPTRIRLRAAWDGPTATRADVAIHIFGLAPRRVRSGQLSAVWIISHPELVTLDMVHDHDLVFAASDVFAADLEARTGRSIIPLHQATDAARFRPIPGGPAHELLFVANSRGVRRRIVDELTPTDRDLAVYGQSWTPELLDGRYLRGEHVLNDELAAYYSAAQIVLNDHWADMAAHGFLSNRLYDATASGAFVISDHVPGIEDEFDGGIVAFTDGEHLRSLVDHYLGAPDERGEHARRAAAAVASRHTFDHRIDELLRVIEPALGLQPARIVAAEPAPGEQGADRIASGPGEPSGDADDA
ncbi:MAG: glycosyltransferase family protein [Candidatus Limnocylindrales bacterium]